MVTVNDAWFAYLVDSKFHLCFSKFIHVCTYTLSDILGTFIFLRIGDVLLFFLFTRPESNCVTTCLIEWQPHKQKCVLHLRPTRNIHKNNTRSTQSKRKSALNSLHWPLGYSLYNVICMNNFCCKVTS